MYLNISKTSVDKWVEDMTRKLPQEELLVINTKSCSQPLFLGNKETFKNETLFDTQRKIRQFYQYKIDIVLIKIA